MKNTKELKENRERLQREAQKAWSNWKSPKKKELFVKRGKKKKRSDKVLKRKYKRIPKQYAVYIKSDWWKKRKEKFYRENEKRCMACLNTHYIDLHHIVYQNFGEELDRHLVALCRDCHEEFHQLYGVRKSMIEQTNEFIIKKREEVDFKRIMLGI